MSKLTINLFLLRFKVSEILTDKYNNYYHTYAIIIQVIIHSSCYVEGSKKGIIFLWNLKGNSGLL
jgi:hypothetical protein